MARVNFLLPAFNEEESLPALFGAINDTNLEYRIFLVDDGSEDNTAEMARQFAQNMPIEILSHDRNKGLGAAIETGILHLTKNLEPGSVVVTMDSDLTHNPQLVHFMLREIDKGSDVVIASRYVSGGKQLNLPLMRRLLSRGVNLILTIRGSKVLDNTSGYRCMRIESLRNAIQVYGTDLITESGFTAVAEMLLKLQRLGVKVKEIPMVLDYGNKKGASKMNIYRTIRAYVKLFIKFR